MIPESIMRYSISPSASGLARLSTLSVTLSRKKASSTLNQPTDPLIDNELTSRSLKLKNLINSFASNMKISAYYIPRFTISSKYSTSLKFPSPIQIIKVVSLLRFSHLHFPIQNPLQKKKKEKDAFAEYSTSR